MRLLRESCHETGAALLVVSHDREVLSEFEVTRDFACLNAPKPEGSPPNFQPP
jgi:ABC-type lipoprotein export system ATPase subunit